MHNRLWLAAWLGLAACNPATSPDAGPDAGPDDALEAGSEAAVPDDGSTEDAPAEAEVDGRVVEPSVQVGLPAGSDGLGFRPLEPGAELRLQTFGQGGTHLTLGVRTEGFGNRAYVSITLRNLATGAEALSPAPVRPQLLLCHDDGYCDLVPILAMTAGLVEPGGERDGVEVEVQVDVRNDAGLEATTTGTGVLSTADL